MYNMPVYHQGKNGAGSRGERVGSARVAGADGCGADGEGGSVFNSCQPCSTVLRSNQRVYEHACELDSLRPSMWLRTAEKEWIHSGLPACCAPTIRKKQSRSYFEDDNDSGTPWVWHACGWNFEVLKVLKVLKVVTFHVSSIQDFTNSPFTNSPIH